jgi:hypothetical protein
MSGPFVYGEDLETILGSVRSLRKILVFGGPALGKTTLIDAVLDRSPGSCELIRGRRGDPSLVARIASWADDPERRGRDLLIDNLDHVFSVEVERAFRNLPDRSDDGLGRIVATSGTPHKWLEKQGAQPPDPGRAALNTLVHDSTALNAFHHLWLDPWGPGWRKASTLRVQSALKGELEACEGALEELVDRAGRRAFAEMLVRVADGHPALLGAGFSWLVLQLERRAWRRDQTGGPEETGEEDTLVPADPGLLEPLLRRELTETQLETIGRGVDWVEAQSRDAAAELLEMARDGARQRTVNERALLSKSGLVRRDEAGTWGIAGDVIRECILRRNERMPDPDRRRRTAEPPAVAAAPPDGSNRVALICDPRAPDVQGAIHWEADGRPRELALTGASWAILATLAAADGDLVQVPELRERTGQESEKAVRSALQRLTNDLRHSGLDGLVVNVRRKGYLFDPGFAPD